MQCHFTFHFLYPVNFPSLLAPGVVSLLIHSLHTFLLTPLPLPGYLPVKLVLISVLLIRIIPSLAGTTSAELVATYSHLSLTISKSSTQCETSFLPLSFSVPHFLPCNFRKSCKVKVHFLLFQDTPKSCLEQGENN